MERWQHNPLTFFYMVCLADLVTMAWLIRKSSLMISWSIAVFWIIHTIWMLTYFHHEECSASLWGLNLNRHWRIINICSLHIIQCINRWSSLKQQSDSPSCQKVIINATYTYTLKQPVFHFAYIFVCTTGFFSNCCLLCLLSKCVLDLKHMFLWDQMRSVP